MEKSPGSGKYAVNYSHRPGRIKRGLLIHLTAVSFWLIVQSMRPCSAVAPGGHGDKIPVKLLIEQIGNGYSSPAVSREAIFVTGEVQDTGYLFCFDHQGSLIWRSPIGMEWTESFPGSRAQPTIDRDLIYTCSGMGTVSCFRMKDGEKLWSLELVEDLGGQVPYYGYSMPLLIDGPILYCSPGGQDNNVVALDAGTGEIKWTSPAMREPAGHCAPIFISLDHRGLLVTASEYHLMGLDATSGVLLWQHELESLGEIPCNKPLYHDGLIYFTAGPGNGTVCLKMAEDGSSVEKVWQNRSMNTFFGGVAIAGRHLYGSTEGKRVWKSIDLESGEFTGQLDFYKGASTADNEKLYLYNEKGQIALVEPDQGKMKVLDTFEVNAGTGEHFALPVVHDRFLYIRHGRALIVYDLAEI